MVVNRHPYQKQLGKYEVCVGVNNKEGLWKVYNDEEIKLIEKVPVNYSFVTPDQKWIIYGKAKDDRRNLYYLHYFNVETNKEFKVNLPPADFVGAEVYVKTHNKVLITRYQIEGQNRKNNPSPEKTVFYLLDLETGKIEEAKGEFRPLMQTYYRFLQPTKNPNEFWATIPDWENRTHTMFGIYNTENFTFTPLQKLSDILFNSNDMWVDEKEGKIYVVYDGHLLSLPLPTK
jgi:hypothetical protein